MQNIEIKRNKNKRSIQSLIDQSALDNSFNYEAHQLRKAFNQTLLTMNAKNAQREREIQKYKIILKEYEENKAKYQHRIDKLQEELSLRNTQYQQISDTYKETKQKLNYLQYKFENLTENRNLFDQRDNYEDEENENKTKRKLKNDIYNQLNKTIAKKIEYFTKDIKKLSMSSDVEQRIESFLEELLYLNPYSEFHILEKMSQPQNHFGKIKKDHTINITSQDEWKRLQKSLQKLKQVNSKRVPLVEQQIKRQKSIGIRRKLFN